MMTKTAVRTTSAPAPAHAFPQGVRTGPFVQVSGQGPVDPATGEYVHRGDVAAQTRRTLANVAAIIEAAGATFADVISLREIGRASCRERVWVGGRAGARAGDRGRGTARGGRRREAG